MNFITINNGKYIYEKYGIGKSLTVQKGIDKNGDEIIINKIEYNYLIEMNEQIELKTKEQVNLKLNEKEEIEYKVYVYLRNKKLYVKDGMKYSCDFVVYKQHPELCHSQYGIIILKNHSYLKYKDLIGLCRLLHNVKKQLLICHFNEQNEIILNEFQWELLENK